MQEERPHRIIFDPVPNKPDSWFRSWVLDEVIYSTRPTTGGDLVTVHRELTHVVRPEPMASISVDVADWQVTLPNAETQEATVPDPATVRMRGRRYGGPREDYPARARLIRRMVENAPLPTASPPVEGGLREKICVAPHPQLPGNPAGWGALKGVIQAWPRSGTTWLYNAIRALGVSAGHESVFAPGPKVTTPRRPVEVEVSGFVAPYTEALGDIPRCIMVRHPQHLFGSILKQWKFEGDDVYEWLSWRWVATMNHLLKTTEGGRLWRIEDFWHNPARVVHLLEGLGIDPPRREADWGAIPRGGSSAACVPADKITPEAWAMARQLWYEPQDAE